MVYQTLPAIRDSMTDQPRPAPLLRDAAAPDRAAREAASGRRTGTDPEAALHDTAPSDPTPANPPYRTPGPRAAHATYPDALTTPPEAALKAAPAALAAGSALTPAAAIPTPAGHVRRDRQGLAITLMCVVSLIFAVQDALSRHMGLAYPPVYVVMLRYWFFAFFVLAMAARAPGGLRAAARTRHPWLQATRGLLLVAEVVLMLVAYVKLGLIETHAAFTVYPLLVVALSGPVLGETVGWRRWIAVAVGFAGILIILQPGVKVFSPWAALPLASALMFALYGLLTRKVSVNDSAEVSFFWTGIAGVIGITLVGIWDLQPIARADWPWLAGLCVSGALGHYLLIRAYSLAEASSLQPFAYTQLVWVSLIGVFLLGERVAPNVMLGMVIIVGAGLFTWWRATRTAAERNSALR